MWALLLRRDGVCKSLLLPGWQSPERDSSNKHNVEGETTYARNVTQKRKTTDIKALRFVSAGYACSMHSRRSDCDPMDKKVRKIMAGCSRNLACRRMLSRTLDSNRDDVKSSSHQQESPLQGPLQDDDCESVVVGEGMCKRSKHSTYLEFRSLMGPWSWSWWVKCELGGKIKNVLPFKFFLLYLLRSSHNHPISCQTKDTHSSLLFTGKTGHPN